MESRNQQRRDFKNLMRHELAQEQDERPISQERSGTEEAAAAQIINIVQGPMVNSIRRAKLPQQPIPDKVDISPAFQGSRSRAELAAQTVQSVMRRTGGRSKARVFVRKGDDKNIQRTAFGRDKYIKEQPMKLK